MSLDSSPIDMTDTYSALGVDDVLRRELRDECRLSAIEFLRSTASTQIVARELAAPDGTDRMLVVADYQTSGRGQLGRQWSSAAGSSVMFSLVVHPSSPEAMALIPIRAGIAAAEALDAVIGIEGRILLKWPNDLVVDGAKLGGILCEGQIRDGDLRAIVGVGINVRPFTLLADVAASPAFLDEIAGRPIERLEVLRAVVKGMSSALDVSPPMLSDEELARHSSRDWLAGRDIVEPALGRVKGINGHGHLIVRAHNGDIEEVVSGSVRTVEVG